MNRIMNIKNTILFSLALLPGVVCAGASLSESIQPPGGHRAVLTVHAKGDQIYHCLLDQGRYAWALKAPDARLYDDRGRIVGNHYAGPAWEYQGASRVTGRVVKKIDASPETSIPWLLLEVTARKGKGLLSGASYINRINTSGGVAPESGCDANHLGNEKRVAYRADYIFYSKAP